MVTPLQGEIWWAEVDDERRPVLIVTRSHGVEVLTTIVVAPLTRTIRGLATEVRVGVEHGLRSDSVASFDNIGPVPRHSLTDRMGTLGPTAKIEICRALEALADC